MVTMAPHANKVELGKSQQLLFTKKGILVIDDDPEFLRVMEAVATSSGLPITTAEALEDIFSFAHLHDYDVVVVDYHLESFCGLEIAEYIDVFFKDLPVILISGDEAEAIAVSRWPGSIRKFVNKSFGPYAILRRTLSVLQEAIDEANSSRRWSDPLLASP